VTLKNSGEWLVTSGKQERLKNRSKGKIQERKGGQGEILRKGRAGAPPSRGDFPIGQIAACSDADGLTCITALGLR
jgi:hypothetical protein